jgi:hypothetical protein
MRPGAVAGPRCRIRSACALQAWAAAGPAGRHPSQSLDTVPRAWLGSGVGESGPVSAGKGERRRHCPKWNNQRVAKAGAPHFGT